MKRKGRVPADSMESSELHAELEALHPDSFGWALLCCGRDAVQAHSLLQTVYLKVLDGKAVFERKSSFKTWLFGVIKKTAAEQRRRKMLKRLRLIAFEDLSERGVLWKTESVARAGGGLVDAATAPDVAVYRGEVQKLFTTELAALPGRQREVLHLVFYQDLTLSEVAEVLGLSVGSARTHYERGKRRLKARMIVLGVTGNAELER